MDDRTFLFFTDDGVMYGAKHSVDLDHHDDLQQWSFPNHDDAFFDGQIAALRSLETLRPRCIIDNVIAGKYNLYVRHGREWGHDMTGLTTLHIKLVYSSLIQSYQREHEGSDMITVVDDFLDKDMCWDLEKKSGDLMNQLVCEIEVKE